MRTVKRAVLVGHSMGTPIARQFYRKYPQKTLAIVIVDGALRPFGDKKMMDGFMAGFRGPNYKEAGKQMFAGMAGPNLSAELQERIQASFSQHAAARFGKRDGRHGRRLDLGPGQNKRAGVGDPGQVTFLARRH